jgi:hypothetical protein
MDAESDDHLDIRPGVFVRIVSGPDKGRRARVTHVSEGAVTAAIVQTFHAKGFEKARTVVLEWDAVRPTGRVP